MAFLGVKLTDRDQKILEEAALKSGKTLSDHIRHLIRNEHEQRSFSEVLQEIKNHYSQEIVQLREDIRSLQKGGVGGSQELTDIKRVLSAIDKRTSEQHRTITLLGQASPFVSRQLGHQ